MFIHVTVFSMTQALFICTCYNQLSMSLLIQVLWSKSWTNNNINVRDELRWFPISQWIQYKQSALVFKSLCRTALPYLADHCVWFHQMSTGNVCTQLTWLSDVPRVKFSWYSSRSFGISGPQTWNQLPETVRDIKLTEKQFYKLLKTTLFCRAYYSRISCAFVIDLRKSM